MAQVSTARKRIPWSKEPDEVPDYSDWKITLTKKETPSSAVIFSVHRHMVGPQSQYFTGIFKSSESVVSIDSDNDTAASSSSVGAGASSESSNQHSTINFPSNISDKAFSLIVKAFESLLDYCYLENVDLKGTSPVPLLFLCDYLQMENHFESKVGNFSDLVFADMASKTKLHLLYEEIIEFRAAGLSVEKAQTITSKLCYDAKKLLSEDTPLASIADLPLWLNVVHLIRETGEERPSKSASKDWSCNIANFLEDDDNRSTVDANDFQKLSSEEVLPHVDENASLRFLKEEQRHASSKVYNDTGDGKEGKETELPPVTNLQNRCVESLDEANLELDSNKELRERATEVMFASPRVMRTYLDRTLDAYGEEKKSLEARLDDVKKKLQNTNGNHLEARLQDVNKKLQAKSELEDVKKKLQTNKNKAGNNPLEVPRMAAAFPPENVQKQKLQTQTNAGNPLEAPRMKAFPPVPTAAFPTVPTIVPQAPPPPAHLQMPPSVNQVPRRTEPRPASTWGGSFLK